MSFRQSTNEGYSGYRLTQPPRLPYAGAKNEGKMVFTLIKKDNGPLTKKIGLSSDGYLIKNSNNCYLSSGTGETVHADLPGLPQIITGLRKNEAIVCGVNKHADKYKILSSRNIREGAFTRSQDNFIWSDEPLVFFDVDNLSGDPVPVLSGLIPGFSGVSKVITRSVSANISYDGAMLSGKGGYHIYFSVQDTGDMERFVDTLFKRCWLAGHGEISISAAGSLITGVTVFDRSVFRPERLVFEAPPILKDGLVQDRPDPFFCPGDDALDTSALVSVTPDEDAEYHRMVAAAKKKIKPEADIVRRTWVRHRVLEIREAGGETRSEDVMKIFSHNILPEHFLCETDSHGVLKVCEFGPEHDGITMHDPTEPEKGRCKAIFYHNDGIRPCIRSFLHGGTMYHFETMPDGSELRRLIETGRKFEIFTEENLRFLKMLERKNKPAFIEIKLLCKNAGLSLTDLNKAVSNAGGDKNPPHSIACEHLKQALAGVLAIDCETARWFHYDTFWKAASEAAVRKIVREEISADDFFPVGFSDGYLAGVTSMLNTFLDKDFSGETKNKIPFANGVLDIRTGDMTPATREDRLTWRLPYEYDPDATCEPVLEWLLSVLGSEDKVDIIRAYFNSILLSRTDLHKFLEVIGPGGAGKGTLLRLAEALVGGDNVHTTDIKRLEKNNFELAKIYKKRLITITDSEEYVGDTSRLRAITGGDSLPFEEKHKQDSKPSFRAEGMVILAANNTIKCTDDSSGLQRRRITLYFPGAVADDKQKNMDRIFRPYLPGFFNWCLSMPEADVFRVLKKDTIAILGDDWINALTSTNPMAAWLHDRVVCDPESEIFVGCKRIIHGINDEITSYKDADCKLYPNYLDYCASAGISDPTSLNKFSGTLRDLCNTTLMLESVVLMPKGASGRCFRGLTLRMDEDRRHSPLSECLASRS